MTSIEATTTPSNASPTRVRVERAIARRSFCTLATVSSSGQPHAAGVLYTTVGSDLWVSTDRHSRKGRNIAANPAVGVSIPVRRLPVGPPSSIHFAARAELFELGNAEVRRLIGSGQLDAITGHGELDRPDSCLVRIYPGPVYHTYGLGLSLLALLRDPLNAAGAVRW